MDWEYQENLNALHWVAEHEGVQEESGGGYRNGAPPVGPEPAVGLPAEMRKALSGTPVVSSSRQTYREQY